MCELHQCDTALCCLITVLITLTIWELIWKFIALWKSARNNHLAWFICIAIFNTIGILPIIYILKYNKPKSKPEKSE